MFDTPTIGRIVHFVLDEGRNAGEHRPAMVVNIDGGRADLVVFVNGKEDFPSFVSASPGIASVIWKQGVLRSEGGMLGMWHWPERAS